MNETKSILSSKTIWTLLLGLTPGAVTYFLTAFSLAECQPCVDILWTKISASLGIAAIPLAAYFRAIAKDQIK